MAISKNKKENLVSELNTLIADAKAVASATYSGISVTKMQELRKLARENDVTIKVVKNRLVKVALNQDERFKDAELGDFKGQLVYAFSSVDEIAPAQILAKFAKENEQMSLVAGLSNDGSVQSTSIVQALASLPTKDQLRGQFLSVLNGPMTQFVSVTNGAQRGFVQVLKQKSELN